MIKILKPAAIIGLALTVIPPLLLFMGVMKSLDQVKMVMLGGMILWFIAAIPWLAFRELRPSDSEVEI